MADLILRQRLGIPTPNIVLDDNIFEEATESVAGDIYWRYEDEPESEPLFLGSAAAGDALNVPFRIEKAIRFFLVSRTEGNRFSAIRPQEGVQSVFDPNLETTEPVIWQASAATNTQVSIGVNGYTVNAKFRKIEVADNSGFSSGLVETIQEASEFGTQILPTTFLVTKTGVSGTVTKYVRVSHSSNGTIYGTVSNTLTVTFANSGGGGGTGGGIDPCFIGETFVPLAEGRARFDYLFENYDHFIGKEVKSFDGDGNIQIDIIDEIFCHLVFEYLDVKFSDGSRFGVTKEHPFWAEFRKFIAIGNLRKGDKTLGHKENWKLSEIVSIEPVKVPEGVKVYNLRAKKYHHYFVADGDAPDGDEKAVHNAKQIPI